MSMDINTIRVANLKALIARHKNQRAFADAVATAPAYISQILSGNELPSGKARGVGNDLARKIEEKLDLPHGWMDRQHDEAGTSAGPDLGGRVPLISWVKAGHFTEAAELASPGTALDWIDTTVPARAKTFALRVQGDSMEPDFPEGTILIVEPEMEAHAGSYVIAQNGDTEATFKQLIRDGGDWYLKPINPRYPLKPLDGCRIVGVVRAAERRFC